MWDCEKCGRTSYWCRCELPVAAPVLTPEEVYENLVRREKEISILRSEDTALDLLYVGELKGQTPANIRRRAAQMLRDQEITEEVHNHIVDTIRRWGNW